MPAVRDFLSRFTPKRTQSRPTVAPTSSKKLYIDNTEIKSFLSFGKSTARNFPEYAKNYAISLFPIATWIRRYNTTWLVGDLIAGETRSRAKGFLMN